MNSTNEHCATNAIFVGDLTLWGANFGDKPCFHQRFDEYFNRDGLCSFEDVKK